MNDTTPALSRRRLIVAGASAAGAAATVAVIAPATREATEPSTPTSTAPPENGTGYRLSPHVLRYYATARV